jgi:cephalosporin hydroxylase
MVILDSFHTHDHVLKELRLYSPLIGLGHYLICSDTVIEYQPEPDYRDRPWGHGNNPKTALDQFLKENDRFVIDRAIDNKLLFTCIPGGYLKCCKD